MKQKNRKKNPAAKMIMAAVAAIAIGGSALAFAMIDETNSVHIDAEEIENSTLIIGSHLIYLGTMTDQIYEIAMESAEDANQYNRYYKSELSGGAWYDVTEAGALADITTAGTVVQNSEIEALNMTHHTKSDGITYDLRTGDSVCVFDINDPYDLEGLKELEPIKLQYDTLAQMEDLSETNERDMEIIVDVFQKNRETDETRDLDDSMYNLQNYYEVLVRDGAEAAMSDMVMSVMEKIDNARRAEVMQPLNEGELEKMNRVVSREYEYVKGEVTGDASERELYGEETAAAAEAAAAAAKAAAEAAGAEAVAAVEAAGAKEIAAAEAAAAEAIAAAEAAARAKFAAEEEIAAAKAEVEAKAAADMAALKESIAGRVEAARKKAEADAADAAKAAEDAIYQVAEEAGRPELERFTLNTDLVTAIGEAMTNVQESYIECSSNMLTEGTTVLSQVEYELCIDLITFAKSQNFARCDEMVMKLIYLDNISNSIIREEDAERSFIEEKLMYRAEDVYKAALFAGEGEAYRTLSSMAAAATKANVLKQQKNETEIARNEMQFIIQAYLDRLATETAMEHIAERIDGIDVFREGIKADAYAEYANSSVDAYLEWLQQTMKNLQDSLGNRTMDDLMAQKEALQTDRMTALDNNQLGLAKKIDAQIAAIDQEIEDLENYLNDVLNSDNTSASERARAAAQLGEGSASAALQKMKNNALQDMRNGNLDGIENIVDGIGALAGTQPEGALGALKDIYQELSNQELMGGGDSAAIKDLLNKVETVTAEQMDNFIEDLSGADLGDLIEAFLDANGLGGGSLEDSLLGERDLNEIMDGLSDGEMAIVLAGLSMYAEQTGSGTAEEVLFDQSRKALGNGNDYLFEQLSSDPSAEYAPTDRISKIIRYRYIFNDSQKAVTLQQGSQYYKFKAFSAVAEKGGTMEDMTRSSGFQGVIYIPDDAAKGYFGVDALYLYHTNHGVLLTEEMHELALAFFDYLLQAGGEI